MSNEKVIANRFELHDLLGRGGMGEVYRALDTQTGETVAVKALYSEVLANDPNLLERFVREGEALRQLNHPNIVHMIAALEEQGRHYLVMEFVEGGSLKDVLSAQDKLPAQRAIEISLDLADALTRAHRLGIIHRDLKPGNILLAKDGTPRLADFGIAHLESDQHLTRTGVLMGTVEYVSPEVCQGELPDERSDIWSFGVMLFQMLTGKLPFEGQNITAKITAILTKPVPDLGQLASDVPDALTDLVYRMLEKDPQQRIPSVRLVGAELEAMLKGREPISPSQARGEASRFETPSPSTSASKHNLPIQTTQFVGREAELLELSRLLADPTVRLLTIVGVGGMGKTRLALEAGAAQLDNYKHGVYFVSLAPLESIEPIIPTIAQAIGFSFPKSGEPRQQLLDYLREKHMLLIMDNFEHLLEGVGWVSEIIQNAAKVKIIATSRVKLNIQIENTFHLEGMDFPDWETPADAMEYSAVKLFLQSARRSKPSFELVADDLKFVARICRLVGGMPLGILLSAAWVEMLSLPEIAKEIGQSLDFLETSLSDVPERQHSMRVVFDYAWKLLNEKEQRVLRWLSVFRGGFTREAAQEVTAATLRDLMSLVDKSLLYRVPTGRYNMHELLRQYAHEKLFESDEGEIVRGRHLDYFLHFAQQMDSQFHGPEEYTALGQIDMELDNLRTALDWSLGEGRVEKGLWLSTGLLWFWDYRLAQTEGYEWITRLLAQPEASIKDLPRANGLLVAAYLCSDKKKKRSYLEDLIPLAREQGESGKRLLALGLGYLGNTIYGDNPANAKSALDEGTSLSRGLNEPWLLAFMLEIQGWIHLGLRDFPAALRTFEEGLSLSQAVGDRRHMIVLRRGIAVSRFFQYDYAASIQQFEEVLLALRTLNDRGEISLTLLMLGEIERANGRYDLAKVYYLESLEIYRDLGIPAAALLGGLADIALHDSELDAAKNYVAEALAQAREVNDKPQIAFCLMGYAGVKAMEKKAQPAVALLAFFHAFFDRGDRRNFTPADEADYECYITIARKQLDDAAFQAAYAQGQTLTLEQAIELALTDE